MALDPMMSEVYDFSKTSVDSLSVLVIEFEQILPFFIYDG